MWCLISVSSVCLHNVQLKYELKQNGLKWENPFVLNGLINTLMYNIFIHDVTLLKATSYYKLTYRICLEEREYNVYLLITFLS